MRALVLALAVVLLSLAPSSVDAQRRRARPASAAAQYRTLVREAVSEFGAGRWAEARALFQQAHELSPSARTLRGLGMSSFELRDYAGAIDQLRAAIADRRRALTAAQRRHAEGLIARAEAYVARFTLTIAPPDATVRVDGAPIERASDGDLVLALGAHQLRVERDGYVADERRLDVRGGERVDLEIRLAREAPVAATTPREDATLDLGPVPVVLLIAGAGLAAVGIGSAIWLADRERELGVCDAAGLDCVNRDTLAGQRDASIGVTATAFVGAGLVAAAGAVLLVLATETAAHDRERDARVACAPIAVGFLCAGTF